LTFGRNKYMRKIHRWLGVPAAIFLLLASFTGVWLECVKFFGAEETARERIRDLTSSVTAQNVAAEFGASFDKARAAAAARAGAQPLDKMIWQLKGDAPTITFIFGSQGQQAGRRIAVHARTGEVLGVEDYAEDSLILRLHSGEAFGDGGMVLGMVWGTLLFALTVTGMIIYFRMKPRAPRPGIRKVFWAFAGALILASGDVFAGPILDLNYAVVPTVRLNLTLAEVGLHPDNGLDVYGFGTTDFIKRVPHIDIF